MICVPNLIVYHSNSWTWFGFQNEAKHWNSVFGGRWFRKRQSILHLASIWAAKSIFIQQVDEINLSWKFKYDMELEHFGLLIQTFHPNFELASNLIYYAPDERNWFVLKMSTKTEICVYVGGGEDRVTNLEYFIRIRIWPRFDSTSDISLSK